ncbi:MAG: ABC transporter permease subunit [Planctomycetota bacterium]|jgi:NitT/TauT family transport system permease protein|nr:ABC transporter permease subunit [Planctomycetota bacterium]
MQKELTTAGGLLGAAIIFAALIAAYALLTDATGYLDPMIFPGWGKIIPAAWGSRDQFYHGIISSLGLLIPSVAAALVAGVTFGVIIGLHPRVKQILLPLFRAANPLPPTMLIPYAIAVFPSFYLSSTSIIFIGVFWPVIMGTLHGVALLEPRWLDNAQCLNLRGLKLVRKVVLPGAMPSIFAGIGSGLIFSFILLTVAEMFGATAGLGYFVQYYADFAEYDRVIGGMIFLSVVVIAIMVIFDRVQNRVLHWTKKR